MKLQAGNPNLMRINKEVSLGAFANTLGDVASKKKHRPSSVYVPIERDPDAVPPATNSLWSQPVYKPDHSGYQRPGSDHSHIKRRGF
jgi:hypothetical protein